MDWIHWLLLFFFSSLLALLTGLWLKVQKLKHQLDLELSEKQKILSVVSHDIKSPFSRISALQQLIILDDNELSDHQKSFLEKIHQVLSDGLGLIRNLVDYRNLEFRRIDVILEEVDISSLLGSIVKKFMTLAKTKKQELTTQIPEGAIILSDFQIISRVIDNILANAIKFSPEGKQIKIRLYQKNGHWNIGISDEGPGFPTNDIPKLFTKFQKLTAKPTSGESTTGLGLHISKDMLDKVGGEINFTTEYGKGSTFTIVLPNMVS